MDWHGNQIEVLKHEWIDHYFKLPPWGRGLWIGVLTAAVGFALDIILHACSESWLIDRIGKNVLEGIAIGFVAFKLSCLRDKRIRHRMKEIEFMNHHIRNAMHTIRLATTEIVDPHVRLSLIDSSLQRVVTTLSRITHASDHIDRGASGHAA
ncbi:MAG TPA: hypothetical protein VHN74_06990 [Candidatus Angelobacter sp.]|jgi:hypothetical protein|nr:hypothetical protein [Candidatus Angelobacter sp.]